MSNDFILRKIDELVSNCLQETRQHFELVLTILFEKRNIESFKSDFRPVRVDNDRLICHSFNLFFQSIMESYSIQQQVQIKTNCVIKMGSFSFMNVYITIDHNRPT